MSEPNFVPGSPLLRVRDLVVDYNTGHRARHKRQDEAERPAVDHVSFELHAGRTLSIVGESGSGKTTVGASVARILTPTDGRIEYGGVDVAKRPVRQLDWYRPNVQVVFQDPHTALNPRMRIGDLLAEPLVLRGGLSRSEISRQVAETLEEVGLSQRMLGRYPRELSGGQRQRVVIGRALVLRPSIVVCDEPTSSLDVSVQAQIMRLLWDLQQVHDLAFIFVTHDLALLPPLGGQIAVMKQGVFVETGETATVLRDPQHDYTKRLLSSVLESAPAA